MRRPWTKDGQLRREVMERPIPWRQLTCTPGRLIALPCVHAAQNLVAYWGTK